MKEGPDIAGIASMIGDPARANMLTALMTGKALTATELAHEAGVTAQTASAHLSRLTDGGLITRNKQGRHRYYALASDEVAHLLETLMGIAAGTGHTRARTGPKDPELRKARVCYNHLAGELGTWMFDSLIAHGHLHMTRAGLDLTESGDALMSGLQIDLETLRRARPKLCRECLDWSARRSHLAGSLGRALLARFEELGWAKRLSDSRVVHFTKQGEAAFKAKFPAADAY